MKGRKLFLWLLLFLLIVIGGSYLVPWSRLEVEQTLYRVCNDDASVTTQRAVDEILSEFPVIKRANLPRAFLQRTEIDRLKFRRLSPEKFFVLKKKDLYRKVAGHLRIRDLFAVDAEGRAAFYFSRKPLYWGIDPAILYKVVELRQELEKRGMDAEAFHCNYGYRHPVLNEAVGGASLSRHIAGDALDLVIGDINQDGEVNSRDKKIVLDLCERKIIDGRGGIGRYPGTQVIHLDLRGKRARWDSY